MDADGASLRRLAKTQPSYEISWAPGRQILYQGNGNRNFFFLDDITGAEKPLLKSGSSEGRIFTAQYSPDGKAVAVILNRLKPVKSGNGLWVISLVDSSERILSSEIVTPIGWSPDARSVYAIYGRPHSGDRNVMMAISAGGGPPNTLFTLPGDIIDACVSLDGRQFICSLGKTTSDVWLVDNFDPARRK
jgi:WD40 repeat protein